MAHIHADGSLVAHRFEASGLGVAPFKFIGVTENTIKVGDEIRPGGCCDYCCNGIRYEYRVQDSAGKVFVVGSECVRHTGDTKLMAIVASCERKLKNKKARERNEKKAVEARDIMEQLKPEYESALAVLRSRPHPHHYFASQGKTLADWYDFAQDGAGMVKKLNIWREVIVNAAVTTAA